MAADLTLRFSAAETPLGTFTVVLSPRGLLEASFGDGDDAMERVSAARGRLPTIGGRAASAAIAEIYRYFDGRREPFRTPIDPSVASTPLTAAIWHAAREIPFGELRTYGDLAASAGSPGAARAAGSAMRRCPVELFVPCHRVVRSGPSLGSYGGGEGRRAALLRWEGALADRA